jgi:hypothetical protein
VAFDRAPPAADEERPPREREGGEEGGGEPKREDKRARYTIGIVKGVVSDPPSVDLIPRVVRIRFNFMRPQFPAVLT